MYCAAEGSSVFSLEGSPSGGKDKLLVGQHGGYACHGKGHRNSRESFADLLVQVGTERGHVSGGCRAGCRRGSEIAGGIGRDKLRWAGLRRAARR